jgi:hypothetical protein
MSELPYQSRNIGRIRLKVSEVEDNPVNWQTHDESQHATFAALLGKLGFYGYPDIYQIGERYILLDGELRRTHLEEAYGPDTEIEFNLTDFTPEEARFAMLSKDPISRMAGTEVARLEKLLEQQSRKDEEALQDLYRLLAEQNKIGVGGTGDPETSGALDGVDVEAPESDVRVQQLFYPKEQYAELTSQIETLKAIYGTANATETILKALECEADSLDNATD